VTIDGLPLKSSGLSLSAPKDSEREQVALAAREFEGLFLLQMLKQMRQSMLSEENNEEPGLGAVTMFDTIDAELSRHLAGQRGGLSTILEQAFKKDLRLKAEATAGEGKADATRGEGKAEASQTDLKVEPTSIGLPKISGRVSSDFGWRKDPLTGETRFHRGLDVAAAYGQEVPVAASGSVVFSGTQKGYGKVVVVQHDGGAETRYAHLSQLDVRTGDVVKEGDVIGRVGQSGRATGPHLHFEVREGGQAVDPTQGTRMTVLSGHD
jgi:murein DD-endopeptidase MepM/ murein hydrolase activator NlpD